MTKHILCNEAKPDDRMIRFIQKHHVMTIATVSEEGMPWCASCFYVYLQDKIRFVFTTDTDTRHGSEMMRKSEIAACIALETGITGRIRGVQMTGKVTLALESDLQGASTAYLKRFPITILKKPTLWLFDPDHIKMTDNRLGFGKKTLWFRP